jgi:hypothetical protein
VLGFFGSKSNSSLFVYDIARIQLFALVHVDDIILTRSHSHALESLIQILSLDFPVKDFGSLNFFLGIEVFRVLDGIIMTQQRYITDIL